MQRDANTREIIKAAREQLTEFGPQDLSLRAVARAVGLAPSALYRYFDSRGALIAALVDDSAASVADAMTTAAAPHAPVGLQARQQLAALREWTRTHPSEFDLLFASRAGTGRTEIWRSLPIHDTLRQLAAGKAEGAADTAAQAMGVACLGWVYTEHFGLGASQNPHGDFEAFLDFTLG